MLEKEKLNIVDEGLIVSIYKTIEIFDVIKNTRIRINNELISNIDKKYLSLLLGIDFTNNEISKILHLLRYNYDIEIYTSAKREEEYERIVNSLLQEEDNYLENFMLNLLEVDFIKNLHHNKGLSLTPLKLLLHKSLQSKEKAKTLQKN